MSSQDFVPEELLHRDVVLDTQGQFVYIGRLESADGHFFLLADVDVHDRGESSTPKEIYIMDARKYGIKKNRKSVHVLASHVVSLSPLEDVLEY